MDKYREAARTIAPLGELTQATQILSEYEKIQLSPEAIVLCGKLWTDMGDYSRAVRAFLRVLDRNASLGKVHYFARLAQLRWNHENEALSEFNNALRLAVVRNNSVRPYSYLQRTSEVCDRIVDAETRFSVLA